ncbi:MAG: hypothetical protein KKD44_28595 [Proteobacteria bacterium]|nr:hypothetical protein [Pseudomonadota bacterium]
MPFNPNIKHIPTIIDLVRGLEPKTIVDLGMGIGMVGYLIRILVDVANSVWDGRTVHMEDWSMEIVGVEAYDKYITPVQIYIYDRIYTQDIYDFLLESEQENRMADLCLFLDTIEHMEKAKGKAVLKLTKKLYSHTIVSTPTSFYEPKKIMDNELDRHVSHWSAKEIGGSLMYEDDSTTVCLR